MNLYIFINHNPFGLFDFCSLNDVQDKEAVKEFLRKLANVSYHNLGEISDIPNNPIKSDDYMNILLKVSTTESWAIHN